MQKIYILCYRDEHEEAEWEVPLVTAFTKEPLQKLMKEFQEASKEISLKITESEHAFYERWKERNHITWQYNQAYEQVQREQLAMCKSHPVYHIVDLHANYYDTLQESSYTIIERDFIE